MYIVPQKIRDDLTFRGKKIDFKKHEKNNCAFVVG